MDRRFPQGPSERRRAPFMRIFIVGLLLAILVLASVSATVLVLFYTGHLAGIRASTPTPGAAKPAPEQTPTPASTPVLQGSLYTAATSSLTRIDLQTGKVMWTIDATDPSPPLVMGQTLFFDNQDSSNYFLEAASLEAGRQLWRNQNYPSGFLLGTKNMLYDSTCNLYATSDRCHLYGINASTGDQLWSYDLPQGNAWIALQNGVLYGVSYTSYFALNASTGAPLWQKGLFQYTDQEANMTPVVSGNVLSFASCNVTKQSSGFPGCYLYAFKADTGDELWHMSTTSSIQATPAIMDGVIYAGAINGTVYAVNEQNGTKLWTSSVGSTVGQLLSSAGMVYVEIIGADGQTVHVEAFDAATHSPRWGQSGYTAIFKPHGWPAQRLPLATMIPLVEHSPAPALSGGPADNPFVLDHGLIYIHSRSNIIDVLSVTNGSQVAEYTVTGVDSISGFTVAAQ
ncbi:MAG TPA: PQQ-binding-like beta-propeller repeat protein [Ktedonobacteraceae bacterium]